MKPSATEVLAAVREVRSAPDEIEALRLMAVFVERVEGETGADFDRSQANASTEEERRRLWPAHARLLQPRWDHRALSAEDRAKEREVSSGTSEEK